MEGGMVGGMYRWAFSRHGAAHSVPPGRKCISLVAMPHAFQGWDEKNPTKSQDKFCVALRGHFLALPPKSGAYQSIQACCKISGRGRVGPDTSKPKSRCRRSLW